MPEQDERDGHQGERHEMDPAASPGSVTRGRDDDERGDAQGDLGHEREGRPECLDRQPAAPLDVGDAEEARRGEEEIVEQPGG